jgi:curved DNA-binding protein
MADYYSILQIPKTATDIEIKNAFRKLAKIYHPDKNPNDPNSKQIFQSIVKAYNTLSNPHLKRRYDLSYSAGNNSSQKKTNQPRKKNQKEWTFTEEDQKRREYYKKHYQAKKQTVQNIPKNNYSDYKYILFAAPIAVALFMLIVSMFNSVPKNKESLSSEKTNTINKDSIYTEYPKNGDTPYSGYFGQIKTFETIITLEVKNISHLDAVIILFEKKSKQYLQHGFLKSNYTLVFNHLPKEGVFAKCMLGEHWKEDTVLYKNKIKGCFQKNVQFQDWGNSQITFNKQSNNYNHFLISMLDDKFNDESKKIISDENNFFEK